MGAPKLVHWLAKTIVEEAEREFLDEGRIRGQILELQERYDAGEVSEDTYDLLEQELLQTLKTIRDIKERRTRGG
ncbi:MAG: gas vesicle protein GvpG [Chloroflexi bacterium]|nr:gas vesicle protein GvpG [Chloroflexota bacterium]